MIPITAQQFSLFQKGFRPFFLAAAAFAAIWVPAWSVRFSAGWNAPWAGPQWHAHEMLFGFLVAVIAGFLLTAVENWTQEKTVTPSQLLALVMLWGTGRVAMVDGDPGTLGAIVDIAFLPALAFFVARPIFATKNKRNYPVLLILTALTAVNVASHYGYATGSPELAQNALLVGVHLVTAIVLLIGGRVIPFFTANATKTITRSTGWLEKTIIVGVLGMLVLQTFNLPGLGTWLIALGLLVLARMHGWNTSTALRIPILAVLHIGHIWLGLGLVMRGLSSYLPITPNLGLHVITLGGLSTISLGMMARVALGHTGRKIESPAIITAAFLLLTAAVVVRGGLPLVWTSGYVTSITVGATLWSLAFGIYMLRYIPILILGRVDGRPG